jgi:hypothetical protein
MPSVQVSLLRLAFSLAVAFVVSLPLTAQNHAVGSQGPAIHGVPPSVTSFGFGGTRGPHGIAPSVTSLGFGNSGLRIHPGRCCFHSRRSGFINPFYGLGYYYPYPPYDYPFDVYDPGDDSMEPDYRGGPTIFDRSGQAARDYLRPQRSEDRSMTEDGENASKARLNEPSEVDQQPKTVLVFRDGHELEISNYAIVGATLYDLSDGRTRKVGLAELDLAATERQNDQNGVDFRLPQGSKLN